MLHMTMIRAGHHIKTHNYLGPGCREHTRIRCLTCGTTEYVLNWEGSVLERIALHCNNFQTAKTPSDQG